MKKEERIEDGTRVAFASIEILVDFSVLALVVLVFEDDHRNSNEVENERRQQKQTQQEDQRQN